MDSLSTGLIVPWGTIAIAVVIVLVIFFFTTWFINYQTKKAMRGMLELAARNSVNPSMYEWDKEEDK